MKKEEISDIIPDKLWENPDFKKDFVLRFADGTTLKVTKINRKAKRAWAVHADLVEQIVVKSHHGHNIDSDGEFPYCTDCEVYVDEAATPEGKAKAEKRDEETLSDGTIITE